MNTLILRTLCASLALWNCDYLKEVRSENGNPKYPALVLNLRNEELDLQIHSRLAACPASTQQEIKFNDEVSITGNCLFSRHVHESDESASGKNISLNICDKPVKPVMMYHLENHTYEIGYELYYHADDRIECELVKHWDYKGSWGDKPIKYHYEYDKCRSVNINNEVQNSTKPSNDLFKIYKHGNKRNHTKFNLTDGSSTLVFHWIPVLYFKSSNQSRQIEFGKLEIEVDYLLSKCDEYYDDEAMNSIFSKANQEKCLENISTPISITEIISGRKSYSCLEKSQIIPLWYFRTRLAKTASCSHMNIIPVWKTIANGQLKKVDQYLLAFQKRLSEVTRWQCGSIIWGVSGILEVLEHKETDPDAVSRKSMHLLDAKHKHAMAIPKIIYRIVNMKYRGWLGARTLHNAAIIIHNDPTPIPVENRICSQESELRGWDSIKNIKYPRAGTAYVCRVTEEVVDKLGAMDVKLGKPLELNSMPCTINIGLFGINGEILSTHDVHYIDDDFEAIRDLKVD